MKRLCKYLLVLVLFSAIACTYPKNQRNYFKRYAASGPFIDVGNLSPALKLRDKYPNEDVVDWDSEILIEFYLDDEDAGLAEQHVNDSLMSTHLKARVTYYHTFLALREHVNLQYPIFYNKQMKVGPVSMTYLADEEKKWTTPTVEDYSYEVDGLYYSDARLQLFSAFMPATGTELTVTYEVIYENVNYLANLFFHESFPVDKRNVILRIPPWLNMDIVEKNFGYHQILSSHNTPSYSHIANFRALADNKELPYDWYEKYPARKKQNAAPDKHRYTSYRILNMNARQREWASAGQTYNYPHLLFKPNYYTDKEGKKQQVLGSLENLYAWYRQLVLRIGNDPSVVAEKAKSLVAGLASDEEKIKAIFYWVQDNVRYIAYEDGIAGFKPEPCQMVYTNLYGDCKGMANLLAEMLKSVGYDARLTWIGTRHIAYDYSEPSMAVDNHMICTVILNGKKYFLDGTEELIELNDYAHRIQGRQVLIEDGDKYLLESIPDLPALRNRSRFTGTFKIVDQQLVGKMVEDYQGESRTQTIRYFINQRSERKSHALERFLNRGKPNHQVKNMHHVPDFKRESPVHFEYDLDVSNHLVYHDSLLWLKLAVLELPYQVEMDSSRLSDMTFGYKVYQEHEYKVEIPSNWSLSKLPEAVNVQNEAFKIKLEYVYTNGNLTLTSEFIVYKGQIPIGLKKEWNQAIIDVTSFYQHYAVFKQN